MRVVQILFSPTGGTRKAVDILTSQWTDSVETVDLSDEKTDFQGISLQKDDIAVIAVPSFAGRVPAPATERLSRMQGNQARCILVCVYGNRAYDDTFAELEDTARQCGFQVTAAVAAIAEHSILRQYATGRPDEEDTAELADFARIIKEKLDSGSVSAPSLPGNRPYREAGGGGMVPKGDKHCDGCGLCAKSCPVSAISKENPRETDSNACISCMRCVSVCPQSARKVNGVMLAAAAAALKKACSGRKKNELFL